MAVEAENICFECMAFGPYTMCTTQDCLMASVWGIEDGFGFQELPHLDQQRREIHPFVDSYDNLAAIASSSSTSSSSFSCCGSLPVEIAQSLSSEFEKQMVEMDFFLQLENKKLRSSILQEESRQQAIIMQEYESRIKTLIRQKDEELAVARNRTRELQHFLIGAETEAGAWEKSAKEKEAIVSDLNHRLNQAKEKDFLFPNPGQVDDAMSFCDSSPVGERREEPVLFISKKLVCKLCQAGSSCVVFFPCKHLCCCKSCEPLLGLCPVCETVKDASLEVFLA